MIYNRFGVYDTDTGYIKYVTECIEKDLIAQIKPNRGYAAFDEDQELFYRDITNNLWAGKSESNIFVTNNKPNVNEDITIANIPAPCILLIDKTKYDIEENEIDVSFSVSGAHRIILDDARFFKKEIKIYAKE